MTGKTVLVVAPHPDDETLGVGGALLRHISEGDSVHCLMMTTVEGEGSPYDESFVEKRRQQLSQLTQQYPLEQLWQLPYMAARLDANPIADMVGKVVAIINQVQPNIVYMPFAGDVHSDHRVSAELIVAATKCFRCESIQDILAYEVLSETDFSLSPGSGFRPNYFVDITAFMQKKIDMLKIYDSELDEHPFPRSLKAVESQAILRGVQGGYQYAEAFMMLKSRR